MRLSAPVYHLKREAKLLSRKDDIPLHEALDHIAIKEGFDSWSLLASKAAAAPPARKMFARMAPGDLVLIGARPGQGKILTSIKLAVEAMKAGNRAVFFTLEYTLADVLGRFHAIGVEPAQFDGRFEFDSSDAISADYIIGRLGSAPRGTLVVIDYLQLLDQRRENSELMVQVRNLKSFARDAGLIMVFISQIDRSYDPSKKPFPDLADVRLPNPLDLALFDKACFLNNGEIRFKAAPQFRG
ncbi:MULTISPECIES: DNA helicase [unclassified Mesorhizobium]|uniref:DNA helicase n=1 Tax=unclassified Mesorhizobium TaxID=325217 RepID=UPI0003CEB7D8|nr:MULTISPECIES: DNA helicase [unclassified Mesorhizobium]ESY22161.1 DNA helicase [Mesorhizobium sp. LNJC395A00]WJI77988.1 DNA helicase [Mesorhizobium sp. C395A]